MPCSVASREGTNRRSPRLTSLYNNAQQALEMHPPPSSSSTSTSRPAPRQHVRLGINRSDYMLHGASLDEVRPAGYTHPKTQTSPSFFSYQWLTDSS